MSTVLAACCLASACSSGAVEASTEPVPQPTATATELAPAPSARPLDPAIDPPREPFGTPLPSAAGIPQVPEVVEPTLLRIPALEIDAAPILPVGVLADGQMEIPDARRVGWYRFGPVPGAPGSAVLAAHIASRGIDGVFRHLDRVEVGDAVEVIDANGVVSRYEVTETMVYKKEDLQATGAFDRTGEPRLTLISCGGRFDTSRRSYDSNVVVVAKPA
jgi:LPXTG-site transpeptidase (sortase) family protein